MQIKDKVRENIDSRKGTGKYEGQGRLDIIQRNLDFIKKLESAIIEFESYLHSVQSGIQNLNSPYYDLANQQPLFESRLKELQVINLKQKISAQKSELTRLHNRFSRDNVQIAFIGQARQGKSSFLQQISGLDDNIIPSSSATDCTGAILIIQNYSGESKGFFEVELEYYSVLEFVSAVNHKLSQLFPSSKIYIDSLDEIPHLSHRPEFRDIEDDDIIAFKETYIDGFPIYSPLLGQSKQILKDESIVAEMVAKYKMFPPDKSIPSQFNIYRQEKKHNSGVIQVFFCKYVAVKVANIKKNFPYADSGDIVLVDTIGLGNAPTEVEDKAKMFDVLKNESDAAVYIYKPSEDGASKKPKSEISLLEELQRELTDYNPSMWMVGVINKKSRENCSKKGQDYKIYEDYLKDIQRTFNAENVLAWCEIVDAMSESEVTDKLIIPLLQTIIKNISTIDASFMINANESAESIYREYMELCSKIETLGELFITNGNKKSLFDVEYENLPLKTELTSYTNKLYALIHEPCSQIINDLHPFINKITSYVPKACEIESKINQGGMYAWTETVYSLYMDNIRSNVLSKLKQVGSQSILAIQCKAQKEIIQLMYDSGNLKHIKLKSSSSESASIEWFNAIIGEKLKLYPILKSAFHSVANFEMRIEGFLYSKCICACELLRPEKTKLPMIEDRMSNEDKAIIIQQALFAVLSEVKQRLMNELGLIQQGSISLKETEPIRELSQPNLIVWCMTDIFQQEIRNGQGARELENFYWENANQIWRDKILKGEKMHETASTWGEWTNRLNDLCELNYFKVKIN